MSITLRYRTFNQLFEDVTVDIKNVTLQNRVLPATLIKIARRCNYDLGLKIHRTRQIILDIENYKVRLPEDMHKLNYALICGESTITEALPQGTHIEERLIVAPEYHDYPDTPRLCQPDPDPCDPPDPCTGVCINKCGEEYQLVQKIKTYTRTYKHTYRLHIDTTDIIEDDCINKHWNDCKNIGTIKDNVLTVNLEHGKIYINYEGDLIDDDGNLLVPEHELINEYYEYALKQRIFENMYLNGEDNGKRMELVEARYRVARNQALNVVNMPDFKELQKIWRLNRTAQYHKYYNMFSSNR